MENSKNSKSAVSNGVKKETSKKKELNGVVVSNKMKDTVVVTVKNYKKHPRYGKYISIDKKYKAHDAGNTKNIGDKVTIRETRPISKDKHFVVVS
ncbi:MAG: 30S ribosomal protein S17 [Minisyncoccia bacterium]